MSASTNAHPVSGGGRPVALWLAFLLIIGAGVSLAWIGAGALRPEISSSGLQFRTVKAGSGEPIGPADAAFLDYLVTTDDGTVLDSSESHNGPQTFFINMPGLFPGFAEAMTKMRDGGEYRFTMPQRLAFGTKAPPPGFPAGSNLTFEVRVRKIVRGAAAMMQQGAPQPQDAAQQ
jgi:FKBP-type peptidyl-prolyl cis-trans isomerase FkpA